ncbi:MAG: hypothetical protein QM817_32465 [Archangium sp.]
MKPGVFTAMVAAVTTVTPFELLIIPLAPLVYFIVVHVLPSQRRAQSAAVMAATALSVWTVGLVAPLKHDDLQRLTLKSQCVRSGVVLLQLHAFEGRDREEEICFATTTPTNREAIDRLAAMGIRLRTGYCGTSATLLFGAHPMSRRIVRD